nr:putative integron gene cassette protein [uncultured bacterium]
MLLFGNNQMSKNPLNQILDDRKQNTYLFVLFVATLLFGLTLVPAIISLASMVFLVSGSVDQLFPLTLCSCSTYPLAVMFGLGAAWYFFTKNDTL